MSAGRVGGLTFNLGSFHRGGVGLDAVTGVRLHLRLPRTRAREKRVTA